ncbi:MAG: hypothetical protein KGL39_25835 [Patescibacteria group bacterium]|nr:hypothetical protein [Patescibacteria group bacterium]
MRLLRLGDNAYMLETPSGALLFSYELPAAVRVQNAVFRNPAAPLSIATRAHLQRFAPGRLPPVLGARQFAELTRKVLNGGLYD